MVARNGSAISSEQYLRSQHEDADDGRNEDRKQQRAVVGKLTHGGGAAFLLHRPHGNRIGRGGDEHGGDGGGPLTKAVADREQAGGRNARRSLTMKRGASRPSQLKEPPMMSGRP